MSGLFVTGTDTGCGKTTVTLALLWRYRQRGLRVAGMKPVASGAHRTPAGLRNDDAEQIRAAGTESLPYEWINPCCLEPPVAPHIAAARAGAPITLPPLVAAYQRLEQQTDLVIVEGAGGLLAPLNEREGFVDLIQALQLPTLLVVGLKLGCINHALLTAEAMTRRGIPPAGWIANPIEPEMREVEANIDTLKVRFNFPYLGHLPVFSGKPSPAEISSSIGDFSPDPFPPML